MACKCKNLYLKSTIGMEMNYSCKCGETKVDKRMPKKLANKYFASMKKHKMHTLCHKFMKEFMTAGEWKLTGYELMEGVEKFANKHKEIIITRCDDDSFCSSYIVAIPHQNEYELWGITFVYIPQCHGDPATFFFYPTHLKDMIEILQYFAKICRSFGNKNLDSMFRNKKEVDILPKVIKRRNEALEKFNSRS